jgi:NTE family protein
MDDTKQVSLVIGSGSVKCAAAIGLYKVLQREGIEIKSVVGCSGGSIYAALIALGKTPEECANITMQLWTHKVTAKHKSRAFWQILFPKRFGFDEYFGMVDDTLANQRLRDAFGDSNIEDTKIPLSLTATDMQTGEMVVMTKGKMVDAVRGSIAIPYIFPAYRVDGHLLVDGFLSDPLPIGVAIKDGANIILAMGFESPYQGHINSLLRYAFEMSSIMSNNLLKSNYAFHSLAHHGEVIPILPEFHQRIGLFDTDKIPYIIEEGEKSTEAQLPYLKKLLA